MASNSRSALSAGVGQEADGLDAAERLALLTASVLKSNSEPSARVVTQGAICSHSTAGRASRRTRSSAALMAGHPTELVEVFMPKSATTTACMSPFRTASPMRSLLCTNVLRNARDA